MKRKQLMMTLAAVASLSGCGTKDDLQKALNNMPPPPQNPAVLSVAPLGSDFITAPRNVLTFDSIQGTSVTWEMTYQATENRAVQVLDIGSSANSGCSIGDAQESVVWTPAGGSATTAAVGNGVIPGDNYQISAGTQYQVHYQATLPSGCTFATFNLVVVTVSAHRAGTLHAEFSSSLGR